jgi:hypothetical protein
LTRHDRHIAAQLYQAALARGATPVAARYLVGAAYAESGFNPLKTGSDGGTSAGLMQTGTRLFNRMLSRGQVSPVAQMNAYIDALQANAPQTWAAMNNASTIQGVFSAQHANPGWRMGALTGQRAPIYASQFSPFNNLPIPELNPPPQGSAATPQPPPPIPQPVGMGQLTPPEQVPYVPPPMEPAMSMQQLTPAQMAYYQSLPGPTYSQQQPGFTDLGGVVPPRNLSNPGNIGTYNPEGGMQIGLSPYLTGDFNDYQFSLPSIAQPPISNDYMFGAGSPSNQNPEPTNDSLFPPSDSYAQNPVPWEETTPDNPDDYGQGSAQGSANIGFDEQPGVVSAQGFADVGNEAVGDFNAANQTYGEGMWYYNQNGDIVPVSQTTGTPIQAQQQQPSDSQQQEGGYIDPGISWPSPDVMPTGMNQGNATGVFAAAGPFSTPGAAGPQFSSPGIGARFDSSQFDPHIGMFGLGAMNAASGGGFSLGGGPSWADQMVSARGGPDIGFGDKGAVQDFLDQKHGGLGAQLPSPTKIANQAINAAKQRVPTTNHFNWNGTSGGPLPNYYPTLPPTNPATPNWTPPGYQQGGVIPGHDYGFDSQYAMLEPGEVVLNRQEQQAVVIDPRKRALLPHDIAIQLYKSKRAA